DGRIRRERLWHRLLVPAKPVVDGKPGERFPLILNKEGQIYRVVRISRESEILDETGVVLGSRCDQVAAQCERVRIGIRAAELCGIVDELVHPVDFTAEFECMITGDVGEIVYDLCAAFVWQGIPLQERCKTKGKVATTVGVGFRWRRITDFEFEIATPLEPKFVNLSGSKRLREAGVVRVNANIIAAVTAHVTEH